MRWDLRKRIAEGQNPRSIMALPTRFICVKDAARKIG